MNWEIPFLSIGFTLSVSDAICNYLGIEDISFDLATLGKL